MKRLLAIAALFIVTGSLLPAQDAPTITVTKSDKLLISVGGFKGAEGAAAQKILQNDLTMSGYFTVVPAERAQFVVSADAGAGSLQGSVADRGGKTVLSKTFSGGTRSRVHQFADEIVETLTGNRGIANT